MSQARYSQPLPATPRHVGEDGTLFAGFVNGREPGFILRQHGKEIPVEATPQNRAKEHPGGFAAALARLWAAVGGRK